MMSIEEIAAVAHAVNRAYCEALGDASQPAWNDAPDWQRESAIAGVGFVLSNPDAPPEASHDNWAKQKFADGWTWGPFKNAEIKQHPCLLAFNDLPQEQRAKDYLFRAVVRELAAIPV
jgi:hypothetical protein